MYKYSEESIKKSWDETVGVVVPLKKFKEFAKNLKVTSGYEYRSRWDHVREKLDKSHWDGLKTLGGSVFDLDLSTRAITILHNEGIQTIKQLVLLKESEIFDFKNAGRTTVNNLKDALEKLGLSLYEPHGDEL